MRSFCVDCVHTYCVTPGHHRTGAVASCGPTQRQLTANMPESVTIGQGELQGVDRRSYHGKDYVAFMGIPFAEAARFQLPQPAKGWEGVLKADKKVECLQRDAMMGGKVKGKEDGGLVVNVFVTKEVLAKPESPVPVMVWIHGGAFILGSGTTDMFSPVWFMDHGVIIVTLNYRLGPFGFLSTGDDEIPANIGLWDQRMALIWVKDNISQFGGDPANVTIFGESAGSMSVGWHILSPQSAGLFHKAICQSGSALSSLCGMSKHPASYARKVVKLLGGDPKAETKELKEFLENAKAKELLGCTFMGKMHGDDKVENPKEEFRFTPIVDDFCSNPFMPEEPIEMLRAGRYNKVPFITGLCKDELGFMSNDFIKKKPADVERFNKNIYDFTAHTTFNRDATEDLDDDDKEAIDLLLESYVGKKELTKDKDDLLKYYAMYADAYMLAPTYEMMQHLLGDNKIPTYFYRLSHPAPVTLGDIASASPFKLLGRMLANKLFKWDVLRDKNNTLVSHADDTFLMFEAEILHMVQRWTPEDIKVSETMIKMWTNFAKHGDPTPGEEAEFKWNPLVKGEDLYLEIDAGTPRMTMDPTTEERLKIWRQVYDKIGQDSRLKRSLTWNDPLHGF